MEVIKIKYHPAEKEIRFDSHQYEENNSIIDKYKESFVLQQQDGKKLCSDIVSLGVTSEIKLEVTTTKEDYKDFQIIVEDYNRSQQEKQISLTLFTELPDMSTLYDNVIKYGERITRHIENNPIQTNIQTPIVQKIDKDFNNILYKYSDGFQKDIKLLEDKNINLCVAGVYSTGKSVLINAILGYEILPKAMKSETANIFRIKSPKNKDEIKISFYACQTETTLSWDTIKKAFNFITEKKENQINMEITQCLKDHSSKESYQQLYEIIKILNNYDGEISDILIEFPIPLDTDTFKFTIFDTPGTNSNSANHQEILSKALSEQMHSIMIFVIAPDKIEGTGNKAILKELKKEDESKTPIDIDRSIFVMNKADTSSQNELKIAQKDKIKEDGLSIDLTKQKLFFLSAIQGYIAKAKKNNSEIRVEDYNEKTHFDKVDPTDEDEQFYRFNQYGESDILTKQIHQKSSDKLSQLSEKHDQIIVSSGLYALEFEIKNYGEKYFIAVRTYSVITCIRNFLNELKKEISNLVQECNDTFNKMDIDIDKCRDEMLVDMSKKAEGLVNITPDFDELEISNLYVEETVKDICNYCEKNIPKIKKVLMWDFSKGKIDRIEKDITQKVEYFQNNFIKCAENVLRKNRTEFIENIREIINPSEEFNNREQEYTVSSEISFNDFKNEVDIQGLFNHSKKDKLFKLCETIDTKELINKLEQKCTQMFNKLQKNLEEQFIKENKQYSDKTISKIKSDIDKLSTIIERQIEDKKSVEKYKTNLEEFTSSLETKLEELDEIVWKEKNVE